MKFWDTSAVAALLLKEVSGPKLSELLQRDEQIVVWWSTIIECTSAIARARRTGRLTSALEEEALQKLREVSKAWHEITPWPEVRKQAQRLVRIHPLRTGDALQLGAAIVWTGHAGEGEFVSLDERLREVARLEGFDVLPLSPQTHY